MKKLIFVHVPKTGGVSIRRALPRSRPPTRVLEYGMRHNAATELLVETALEDETTEAIVGHFYNDRVYGGLFTRLRRRTTCLATMLRHPVERVYSLYRHSLAHGGEMAFYAQRGLKAFVTAKDPLVRNAQARQLSGPGAEKVPGVFLASAMAVLSQFDVVGVTEHFDAFVVRLEQALGCNLDRLRENSAQPKSAHPLTDEMRSLILSNNAVDMALWYEACRRARGQ